MTAPMGDNSKARRELGYEPRPLREGVELTLRHALELLGKELKPKP